MAVPTTSPAVRPAASAALTSTDRFVVALFFDWGRRAFDILAMNYLPTRVGFSKPSARQASHQLLCQRRTVRAVAFLEGIEATSGEQRRDAAVSTGESGFGQSAAAIAAKSS